MDPRRLLSAAALLFFLGGCAMLRPAPFTPMASAETPALAERGAVIPTLLDPAGEAAPDEGPEPVSSTERPYLEEARDAPARVRPGRPAATGASRAAIADANRQARAASDADTFVGGLRVFTWDDGRVYEVRTAPLRVTILTLAAGETVTAKAAGDTVRWQIGESRSGADGTARTHVLIKPLQSGLETNLVLTTNQRVYLLSLKSGDAETFNAAVVWRYGAGSSATAWAAHEGLPPPVDVTAVTPQGPLDARYAIEPRGRRPAWAPTAVFNDGVRTFITLAPDAAIDETPALFVRTGGDAQLVNYRQADGVLIVDRVFGEAELRLGDHRPQIVRIRRLEGARR